MVQDRSEPHVNTANLLGIPISLMDMNATLDWIAARVESRVPSLVITADATALVIAQETPKFMDVLREASLITADSVGILWALRKKGIASPHKVSGVDLVAKLTEISSQTGLRIYYMGSSPGVAEMAAEKMRLRFPGCNIVGTHHGYFPADSDDIVAQEIAAAKPDILFVAMGMPRQEEFILKTMTTIQAPVAMGVGGSFDVFSGKTKRAPILFQKLHMEWLWRLALNPTKIAKVKKLPQFAWMVIRGKV
ncbi:MAG: WecB/TagA/CpsF family glycosyltransferase [Armatimonadetes bacterium]|nr:WecB/TagA/CpsF family glycosyltransferase [Armatimonadota bacterium]